MKICQHYIENMLVNKITSYWLCGLLSIFFTFLKNQCRNLFIIMFPKCKLQTSHNSVQYQTFGKPMLEPVQSSAIPTPSWTSLLILEKKTKWIMFFFQIWYYIHIYRIQWPESYPLSQTHNLDIPELVIIWFSYKDVPQSLYSFI